MAPGTVAREASALAVSDLVAPGTAAREASARAVSDLVAPATAALGASARVESGLAEQAPVALDLEEQERVAESGRSRQTLAHRPALPPGQ